MIECQIEGLLEAEKVGHTLLDVILLWVLDGQCLSFVWSCWQHLFQWRCLGCICLEVMVACPGRHTDICFAFSPVF